MPLIVADLERYSQFYIACCSISDEHIESVQDLLDRKHITTTQIYDKLAPRGADSAPHKGADLRDGPSTEAFTVGTIVAILQRGI